MTLTFPFKIRENIHGTVPLTALEKEVIDHPIFQRLRDIRQLSFVRLVFPGATHSRFEHSIGVMHLIDKIFLGMIKNQSLLLSNFNKAHRATSMKSGRRRASLENGRPMYGEIASTQSLLDVLIREQDSIRQALRLAALLHDVGHAPFSHSSESWLPLCDELARQNSSLLTPFLRRHYGAKKKADPTEQASHEDYSLLLITKVGRGIEAFSAKLLEKVLLILTCFPRKGTGGDLQSKICVLLHDLISNEIDADRMDYMIRDSHNCGVSYGMFDYDRLLDSFSFYNEKTSEGEMPALALKYSGLQAFEDYLLSRYQMYSQVYFHKTSVAFDAMMDYLSDNLPLRLPAAVDRYCELHDGNFPDHIRKAISQVKNLSLRKKLSRTFLGLFSLRSPWKRIYEINLSLNPSANGEQSPSELQADRVMITEEVARFCGMKNAAYRLVESEKWFTRLLPRTHRQRNENRLRLIKKNVHGVPFVLPIENYSPIIDTFMRRVNVLRIYIEDGVKSEVIARLDTRFQNLRYLTKHKTRRGAIVRSMTV